jgi:HEPN domain-containing protein
MNKEKMLQMAERNLRKAKIALEHNFSRNGITETEKQNLTNNVEYAQKVYDLITNYVSN